uniref:Uncharacterized protein n=1 Tax=Amphimedon queenslandica TaxID=400682 RepID=A0A1X7UGN0_AMPQE
MVNVLQKFTFNLPAIAMSRKGDILLEDIKIENVSLLKEINDLRRELKTSRSIAHDFKAALKIARKNRFDD